MALVHVISTQGSGHGSAPDLLRMRQAAELDRIGAHALVDHADAADLVLFTDPATPDMADIRQHPLYRQHAGRCFVLAYGDRVLPFVPGVFTCAETTTHPARRSRTGPYMRVVMDTAGAGAAHSDAADAQAQQDLLFSFVGRTETAPVRAHIGRLRHPRALVLDASLPGQAVPADAFSRLLERSKFVLCPRGYGTSSFRLFETLRAGRVPVIVSDDWVPCTGPDWQAFSLHVREADVEQIPRLLEQAEVGHAAMQAAARETWADWFAPDVVFQRTVDWCLDLQRHQPASRAWDDVACRLGRWSPAMLRWHWAGRAWRRRLKALA